MGAETANVHLGVHGVADAILKDLADRPGEWLADAARAMAEPIRDDWRAWRRFTRRTAEETVSANGRTNATATG